MEVGTRVGAIYSASPESGVKFLGYGVYEGDEIPPSPPAMFGFTTWAALDTFYEETSPNIVESAKAANGWPIRLHNPKIRLDSGKVVWGQECWWGPEDKIANTLENYRASGQPVVNVDIEQERSKHERRNSEQGRTGEQACEEQADSPE